MLRYPRLPKTEPGLLFGWRMVTSRWPATPPPGAPGGGASSCRSGGRAWPLPLAQASRLESRVPARIERDHLCGPGDGLRRPCRDPNEVQVHLASSRLFVVCTGIPTSLDKTAGQISGVLRSFNYPMSNRLGGAEPRVVLCRLQAGHHLFFEPIAPRNDEGDPLGRPRSDGYAPGWLACAPPIEGPSVVVEQRDERPLPARVVPHGRRGHGNNSSVSEGSVGHSDRRRL